MSDHESPPGPVVKALAVAAGAMLLLSTSALVLHEPSASAPSNLVHATP